MSFRCNCFLIWTWKMLHVLSLMFTFVWDNRFNITLCYSCSIVISHLGYIYIVMLFSRVLLTSAAKYFLGAKKLHICRLQTRAIYFSTTTALGHSLCRKITSMSHHLLPGLIANDSSVIGHEIADQKFGWVNYRAVSWSNFYSLSSGNSLNINVKIIVTMTWFYFILGFVGTLHRHVAFFQFFVMFLYVMFSVYITVNFYYFVREILAIWNAVGCQSWSSEAPALFESCSREHCHRWHHWCCCSPLSEMDHVADWGIMAAKWCGSRVTFWVGWSFKKMIPALGAKTVSVCNGSKITAV